MANPRIVSTLTLVFVAGVATGMLVMKYGLHEMLHPSTAAAAATKQSNDAVVRQFRTKLDLTPEQTDKIAMILEDYRQYYESLQDQIDDLRLNVIKEQLEDLRSTGKTRILEVLNPAQREKFEKMMSELAPQLDSEKK